MVCLGFEPRAAGWKAQTKPRRYGCRLTHCLFVNSKILVKWNELSFVNWKRLHPQKWTRTSLINVPFSVTRLGDLLDFGQVLKPLATINLPYSPTFLGIFVKVTKSFIFPVKYFLGNFYGILAIFSGHTGPLANLLCNIFAAFIDWNTPKHLNTSNCLFFPKKSYLAACLSVKEKANS